MPTSLALALAAAVFAAATVPPARWLAWRTGAIDHPDERRIHREPMPRLGGLAIAAAVLAVAWLSRIVLAPAGALEARPLAGLPAAAVPILALGIADDRRSVSPWVKLAVQACAALTLAAFGFGIRELSNPFGPTLELGAWNLPLTVIWVMLVTNAINLIDGLDGLAAGVVAIAAATLWVVGRGHADFYVMFLSSLLIGACAGFLVWNFPPARIFMGDTGSQFLGFMLAALSLLENRKGTAAVTLLLPLTALALPLADSASAMLRRARARTHVFRGDTEHIHHRVLALGLSPRAALFCLWALAALCGGAAVLLSQLPRVQASLVALVLAAVLMAAFEWLRRARAARNRRLPDGSAARD